MSPLRRRWLPVVTAVLVAGAAASCGGSVDDGGPMVPGNAHGYGFVTKVGDTFTDGFEILRLGGESEAKIEKVEIEGDAGLKLLGAKVVGPDRSIAAIQYFADWPASDPDLQGATIVDAKGATITPQSQDSMGWELLVGLEVTEPGHLVRDAVLVTYTVGDQTYRVRLPAEIAVCAGPEYTDKEQCPSAEG